MPSLKSLTKEEVRAARKRLGLTQEAFAQALGVSLRTVEVWEGGRSSPPPYLSLALIVLEQQLGRAAAP